MSNRSRSSFLLALVFVFAFVTLASGCRESAPPRPEASAESAEALVGAENLAVVQERPLSTGPKISGSLEPEDKAVIRAEVAGSLLALPVEIGQAIKKGQLLARIEANALGDAVRSSTAAVTSAEQAHQVAARQLERTARLVQAGALAERDLELDQNALSAATAQLAETRARLASAREQLERATVRAPMDGVVSERPANQGDVVSPGGHLLTLIAPSSMRLQASVPSAQLQALRVGGAVSFVVRGLGEQRFEGTIERIAPAADPVTRQVPILVKLPNPDGRMVAGLFAEGRIQAEQRQALALPTQAVQLDGARATVKRVREGRVEEVEVQLGVRDEGADLWEIRSGVAAGDQVLQGRGLDVGAGTRVKLQASSPSPAPIAQ